MLFQHSFLLNQSQPESISSVRSLRAFCCLAPVTPCPSWGKQLTCRQNRGILLLQRRWWFSSGLLALGGKSEYFNLFLSKADSTPSTHGMVSSMMSTILTLLDHITISGQRLVLIISLGNWNFLPGSSIILKSWLAITFLGGTCGTCVAPIFSDKLNVMVHW